jgi:hypothetical protein
VKTTFAEDDFVQATGTCGTRVERGDKGRVIEEGTWESHRVYWPRHQAVIYHLGSQLKLLRKA